MERKTVADRFDPSRDLLYGLNKKRLAVQGELETRYVKGDPYEHSDITVDRINNRLGLASPFTAFSIKGPALSSRESDVNFQKFLAKREKAPEKTFEGRETDDRIRRASKLGIEYTHERGGKVHFLLGGIEETMEDIANKRNFRNDGGKDFTASELRYVYRNRERLAGTVRFYNADLEPVAAPWETHAGADAWAQYKPGTGMKHTFQPRRRGSIGSDDTDRSSGSEPSWMSDEDVFASTSRPRTPEPSMGPDIVSAPVTEDRRRQLAALDLAEPRARPGWNSSTRLSQPLSASAFQTTTRPRSTDLTGKIGSSHWPTIK